jgi:hypothetical protein
MRGIASATAFLFVVAGCEARTPDTLHASTASGHQELVTMFDSLAAIHRDHPDTGILRRLHPPGDTILHIEGSAIERFTGDSLFRRVIALHVPVRSMRQEFTERSVYSLDADHAVLTARERVEWVDATGPHTYAGILTLTVVRVNSRWVIRTYRGT